MEAHAGLAPLRRLDIPNVNKSAIQKAETLTKLEHEVAIHDFPLRGDDEEGGNAIGLFGWLRYPMQTKMNFECRDSILAAPLVLDVALLGDLAPRAGEQGPQERLSFFEGPVTAPGRSTVHDLFRQRKTPSVRLTEWAGAAAPRDRAAAGRTS